MKKEQLDGKFIICRTRDEFEFIKYHADKLLGKQINISYPSLPICIRLKNGWGFASHIGFYTSDPFEDWGCEKEEECSMLFGNLVKRWKHEHRTENSDSLP